MHKRIPLLRKTALATALFLAMATAHAAPASKVWKEGEQILSKLKSTRYSHKGAVDEEKGIYILDCSSLACHILSKAAPASLESVPVDPRYRHARAKNFCDTFLQSPADKARNGWLRIVRVIDAEPGDFIAWKKDPMPPKGNTGHVVMVLEKPVLESDGTVRVVVLDASSGRHANDTRKKGENGVGSGTIWFKVDESGAPVAVHWSTRKRPPIPHPIGIGRVAPRK
jgi:cell wall-associated NlpC family hydrolase